MRLIDENEVLLTNHSDIDRGDTALHPKRGCSVEYRGERLGNGGVGAEQFQQLADL
jgi:hypothetical protein